MEFFLVLIIILLIVLWCKNTNLKKRIYQLEVKWDQMSHRKDLESHTQAVTRAKAKALSEEKKDQAALTIVKQKESILEKKEAPPISITPTKPAIDPHLQDQAKAVNAPNRPVKQEPKPRREFWQKVERQFVENWTGILGSIVLVLGIGFLSIYAALKVTPFWRFILITCISLGLFVIYLILHGREKWLKLATWLRSSAGAVFLFGCLGSGNISGLKWIESPSSSLGLLIFGLAVNLYLGYAGKTQVFASLHVILSLAALAVSPRLQVSLILAAVVSLFGVLLTFRARWEYHLLTTLTAFLSYHLYWFFSLMLNQQAKIPLQLRLTGIAVTALIGIAAMFIHYQKEYESRRFEPIPFIVHLLNWTYMAVGFILYSTGSRWSTIVIACAALAAYMLSRIAKKLNIRWLLITDMLLAEAIALVSIYTLTRWEFAPVTIIGFAWIETLIFFVVSFREEENILRTAGLVLESLSATAILAAPLSFLDFSNTASLLRHSLILSIEFILYSVFHFYLFRSYGERLDSPRSFFENFSQEFSFNGILVGILPFFIFLHIQKFAWAGYAIAVAAAILLWLRQRFQMNGLGIGTAVFIIGTHLTAWYRIFEMRDAAIGKIAIYGIPFFLISALAMKLSDLKFKNRKIPTPALYLFTIHLVLFSYILLRKVSLFIPGVLWLILSILYLEIALAIGRKYSLTSLKDMYKKGSTIKHLLAWAWIFLVLFLLRHTAVHLQSESYLAGFKVRLWIQVFALFILLYWATVKNRASQEQHPQSRYLFPLMWDAALVFFISIVFIEVPKDWLPLAWILTSYILLAVGHIQKLELSRFRFYSLFFFWIANFHIAFISSSTPTPAFPFIEQAWVKGLQGIFLLLVYIITFYKIKPIADVTFPDRIQKMSKWVNQVRTRQYRWVYYPYFIGVTLFLYWTFNGPLLTLLWVLEAFCIFVLAIFLRENQFRIVSMLGLSGCLVRLILFDLGRSDTLTRALVFLGVGILMIIMNSLYNKFRDRF